MTAWYHVVFPPDSARPVLPAGADFLRAQQILVISEKHLIDAVHVVISV